MGSPIYQPQGPWDLDSRVSVSLSAGQFSREKARHQQVQKDARQWDHGRQVLVKYELS